MWLKHPKWSRVAIVDVVSDVFLHPWESEFSELYQFQGHHQSVSKQYLLATTSQNLMFSRSPLVTKQPFWTQSIHACQEPLHLFSAIPSPWQTTFVILVFACISPLHFVDFCCHRCSVAKSFWPFVIPQTVARLAPLSMELSWQNYWSG